jgi:hypothetical protein
LKKSFVQFFATQIVKEVLGVGQNEKCPLQTTKTGKASRGKIGGDV